MKLSRIERVMIYNQFKILEKLYPDEAESYAERAEVVENGYELHYDWIFEHIGEERVDEEMSREILDTLAMFEAIQDAMGRGDAAEFESVKHFAKFHGYDGNNENAYSAYAEFFCRSNGGRYQHLNIKEWNAHMPTVDAYRRMVQEYKASADEHRLSSEDVIRICQAAVHPENRK